MENLDKIIPPVILPILVLIMIAVIYVTDRFSLFRENKRRVKMSENTIDINTSNEIRLTDNSPKEGDDFQKADQYKTPMTEDQIKCKLNEILGDQGMA